MTFISPLTRKRFQAFRRIRRAWWSLCAFVSVFVFCLAADWVCPCDPKAVTDPATLEPYREPRVEKVYDVRTVRFSQLDDGTVFDFEGPADYRPEDYTRSETQRPGYVRVYLEPKTPTATTERLLAPPPVSFPFRPCPGHPFGIDAGGRDVYAQVVHGMRLALLFGLALAFWSMFSGVVIGAVEGYFGGLADMVGQRFTEIWSAMPFLYVMIFIGSTIGRSFAVLLVAYAIFNWITVSYYMRAEFLRLRRHAFVDAARVQGFSSLRIVFGQILPNALTPLVTLFPFLLMGAIGSLAALDFLGFGLPPMTPSCGELLHQAQQFRSAWWLILFPSLALFLVMLLTVLVGEGLRDAFDPRQCARLE